MLFIALRLRCFNPKPCGCISNLRNYFTIGRRIVLDQTKSCFRLASPSPKILICGGLLAARFLKHAQCRTPPAVDRISSSGLRLQSGDQRGATVTDQKIPWRDLWNVLTLNIGYVVVAIVTAVLAAIVNIKMPLLLGDIVNIVTSIKHQPEAVHALIPAALKLVSLYVTQAVLTCIYISLLSIWGERLASHLRTELFHRLLVQDIAFFDSHRTGELVARLSADVQEFKSAFKQCVSQGLRSVTQTVGCIISLYLISPQMTGVTVALLPCIIACGTALGSSLRLLSRRAQAQVAVATSVADEALSNIRTVRAFAMEDTEDRLFQGELMKAQYLNEILGVGIGVFQGVANFVLNGIVLGVIYGGGKLISTSELSPGQLTSFLVTAQTIQRSLAQLSLLYGQAVKGLSAGARVFEYIHIEPTMAVRGGKAIPYHSLIGEVKFENVHFAYPTRPGHIVLEEFSLRIPPGKVLALCGPSGGGKSTVAALLERFYDVEEGQITIDGYDIRQLDPQWLRGRTIGFISQEPILFHTTIKENIRYGKPDASDQEIYEAATLANAHSFVSSFPHGYDTVVGERGVTLSGGQKQRVAIARALLKKPSILILDEATSALDAESERLVQEALDRVGKGRTVLVIAHRLSTVQNADIIAVIANRRVAEVGTHQELLKMRGIYWQLVKYQQTVPQEWDVGGGLEFRVDIDRYLVDGFDIDLYW